MTIPLFQPFAALRPASGFAQEVIAPPYDVVSDKEARELARGKPWSFLHISRPEIDLYQDTNIYADEVYKKGSENMAFMLRKGILIQDELPAYYIYRIKIGNHIQTGFVGTGSVKAYENNLIRRHELTRPTKEDDRVRQILAVNAQTGPVLAIHKHDAELSAVTKEVCSIKPDDSICVNDAVHTLWVIRDTETIKKITAGFERLGVIYIADGHHRSAAASRVASERARTNSRHSGLEPYNRFLLASFPETEVQILDYNRLVRGANGLSRDQLLKRIEKRFEVSTSSVPVRPEEPQTFGMYVAGAWYALRYATEIVNSGTPIDNLDSSILTNEIITPLLGIHDLRRDPRIDFVGGIRGMEELEKRVDSGGWDAAFALFPITTNQLMTIADAEKIMPPKTTWFEPKLVDGLVSLMLD